MADMRCPAHDVLFQTETDQTKPGTPGKNHPKDERGYNCHPDCPIGKKLNLSKKAQTGVRAVG